MITEVTKLLGIQYPVIQGGMAWVAEHHLAAAVSAAGGLGLIGGFCGHLSGKLDHRARRSRQPVFDPLPPDRTDARTAVCNSLHGGRENRGLSLLFCKWISIRTGGKM